jgi:protein TonB
MLKGGISNGGISKNLLPEYPELARQLGQEGLVVLKVRISKSGNVAEVTLVQSSGYELLDLSALKRVKEWKFTPATWMGVPIESWVTIPIRFKLEG